jgi:RNA polymerase sigma factor (sigma-70 family)
LLRAYSAGDEPAFGELLRKYYGLVYGTALRRVGDPVLAEEVAQSTFIILSRKANTLSSRVSLCGWLVRTARFVAKDALKILKRRLEKEKAYVDSAAPSHAPPTADVSLLEEALLALSEAEQGCVVARFIEGRNLKEVSREVNISEDAAQKRISRGLDKMRRYLTKRGFGGTAVVIPALLVELFNPQAQATESIVRTLQLLAQAQSSAVGAAALATRAARLLAWRGAAVSTAKVLLGFLLVGAGSWGAWQWSKAYAGPAFRLSDPRVETLGRGWSQVVRRVAALITNFPTPPAPGDPRAAAYTADYQFVINETTRISTELSSLITPANERQILAEFLTVELRETLRLDRAQQAQMLSLINNGLSQGPTLLDSMKLMGQSGPAEVPRIKAILSGRQQKLFDQNYGANGIGLFVFLKAATAGK